MAKNGIVEQDFEEIIAPISRLHFHPQNPRREVMADEEAIIAALCEDEGVVNLAKHISAHGLSPLDRAAVVAHPKLPDHFVVAEGNRRLCALQLLRDPERAPTSAAKKIFTKLKTDGVLIPNKIGVVCFAKEAGARTWMSVKHEGEQGGIGTVGWNPTQKARFNQQGETNQTRPKNPNVQSLAMLDYAEVKGLITPAERAKIAITTVTRYLSNPNVRAALALLNAEDLMTDADAAQFDLAIQKFLTDALPPADPDTTSPVSSRTTSAERKAYAEKLRQDGVSPVDRDEQPYSPAAKAEAATTTATATAYSGTKGGKKSPDVRKYMIPSGFRQTANDAALTRMVGEGKKLRVDDFVFSTNYLLRAILERIVHQYAKKHGIGASRDLEKLITACADHAANKATPPAPRAVVQVMNKTASNQHVTHAPDTLGAGVHGGMTPTARDNRRNWDTLQPMFEWLLTRI